MLYLFSDCKLSIGSLRPSFQKNPKPHQKKKSQKSLILSVFWEVRGTNSIAVVMGSSVHLCFLQVNCPPMWGLYSFSFFFLPRLYVLTYFLSELLHIKNCTEALLRTQQIAWLCLTWQPCYTLPSGRSPILGVWQRWKQQITRPVVVLLFPEGHCFW